ncbi:tetratricopeptide repeat protein [Marinibaculum pumilum]|uniref:Tetratricopeptide repeat protein n=1 Tax=Marinibaculum pumilum TaxID=1766165 RepID=A0ABV7KUJ2_9PROT
MARPAGISGRLAGRSSAILHRCLFGALLAFGLQAGAGGALAQDGVERPAGLPPAPLALTPEARAEAFQDSVRLYGRRARAGEIRAQYLFGYLYEFGLGVERDLAVAADWYGKAAAGGSRDAQFRLGMLHLQGQVAAGSPDQAAAYFRQAAEQGLAAAQLNLAIMLEAGQGMAADPAAAARWYRAAALQGNAEAQNNLGLLYITGSGVDRDVAEGVRWLRLAARQGSADGLLNLARLHADGIGVPQDLVMAYALLLRVTEDAAPAETAALAARVREAMAASLSPAETTEAERLSADPGLLTGSATGSTGGR